MNQPSRTVTNAMSVAFSAVRLANTSAGPRVSSRLRATERCIAAARGRLDVSGIATALRRRDARRAAVEGAPFASASPQLRLRIFISTTEQIRGTRRPGPRPRAFSRPRYDSKRDARRANIPSNLASLTCFPRLTTSESARASSALVPLFLRHSSQSRPADPPSRAVASPCRRARTRTRLASPTTSATRESTKMTWMP